MNIFYEKFGRRYREAGFEFRGFPADGIWLVQDGRHSMTCLIGQKDRVPVFALNYRQYVNDLCDLMQAAQKEKPMSLYDEMMWVCDFFAQKAEENGHLR
jgi:hypothetical protein